jgi:hypothetical protein
MGKFISEAINNKFTEKIFKNFGNSAEESFLKHELTRYIPQLIKKTDKEIEDFVNYQRGIYLEGKLPIFGRPIASLNPTFVDSIDSVCIKKEGHSIYTRASVKENGYRMQLQISHNYVRAFTRQFTSYDLRMFPELTETIARLPVMIGDCELINKHHKHLAGFNRVQLRIPGTSYWPKAGKEYLSNNLLFDYLEGQCFKDGQPIEDLELTLAFHGIFAIAPPHTWYQPKIIQYYSIQNVIKLPVDYVRADELLDELSEYIRQKGINARIVEREVISNKKQLTGYVADKEKEGLEGVCIVQSAKSREGKPIIFGKSIKIKKYETIDTILLGLYFNKKSDDLVEDNIKAALLGLYDVSLEIYLPAMKANLDPNGPQIKTDGQRKRLEDLRREIASVSLGKTNFDKKLITLYDIYLVEAERMLDSFLKNRFGNLLEMIKDIPKGRNLAEMLEIYEKELVYEKEYAKTSSERKYLDEYEKQLSAISDLGNNQKKRICRYFGKSKEVKVFSSRLVKPSVTLKIDEPIIIEARVFDVKWGDCPYPAGFHSWYTNSFHFNNVYAERIRFDKDATTDYATIYELARAFTVKKK